MFRRFVCLKNRCSIFVCISALIVIAGCHMSHHTHPWHKNSECCDADIKICKEPSMMSMGYDLDRLEKHIDNFGSVVAMQPSIWGEARLTRYREQFEEEMFKDYSGFGLRLHGSLARSDQAYLASAVSLGLAASQPRGIMGVRRGQAAPATPTALVPTEREIVRETSSESEEAKQTTKTNEKFGTPEQPKAPEPVKAPDPADPSGLITSPDKVITKRHDVVLERIGFDSKLKEAGIGLEPTIILAQKKRYLNYLDQIRRTNEGDDTADSPGYSLNLMRIPVSVLPGKRTDKGFGAEITMTLTPVLSDELLPNTFKDLITNDLISQGGFTLTKVINEDLRNPETNELAEMKETKDFVRQFDELNRKILQAGSDEKKMIDAYCQVDDKTFEWLVGKVKDKKTKDNLKIIRQSCPTAAVKTDDADKLKELAMTPSGKIYSKLFTDAWTNEEKFKNLDDKQKADFLRTKKKQIKLEVSQTVDTINKNIDELTRKIADELNGLPTLSFSNGLENRLPFPTSQIGDVYGFVFSQRIGLSAYESLESEIKIQGYAHLPNVQTFLKEEIDAAFEFLRDPNMQPLWHSFCTPALVSAVRTRRVDELRRMRLTFREIVAGLTQSPENPNGGAAYTTTAALAWAIIVDAALLNDRLMRDMQRMAAEKGCPIQAEGWMPYYLPNPPMEIRVAFNDYVRSRWPIQVFALDPDTEEQNIADALSTRREMQLALSIAFVGGQINLKQLTQYVRRLEAEYETIKLNRTQIGFTHGNETFGWRFYPRFQTPETESNLTVAFRDLLIGGPNYNALLRQRRLEPGPRECVAIVLMPSFVPYVTVDTVSNWFPLTNPRRKVLDHKQALQLSKVVRTIKDCSVNIGDANCYRPGEFSRMLRRVDQLESRLPTQTLTSQVPILRNLGGFEMFTLGTTALAPELYGWYGAPGVDLTKETTDLFLVGDHFSVHQTNVIVGNRKIIEKEMLSRQVMRVSVPAKLIPLTYQKKRYVQAQVATPYGVTRELLIPVVDPSIKTEAKPAERYELVDSKLTFGYKLVMPKPGKHEAIYDEKNPVSRLRIKLRDNTGRVPHKIEVKLFLPVAGYGMQPLELRPKLTTKEFTAKDAYDAVYEVEKAPLEEAIKNLLERLSKKQFALEDNPLANPLKTSKIEVQPVPLTGKLRHLLGVGRHPSHIVETHNQLQIVPEGGELVLQKKQKEK